MCLVSFLLLGEKNDCPHYVVYVYLFLPRRLLGRDGCIVVLCAVARFSSAVSVESVIPPSLNYV